MALSPVRFTSHFNIMSSTFDFSQLPPIRVEDNPFSYTNTPFSSTLPPHKSGGGGASGTFLASLKSDESGNVTGAYVTAGAYMILNTNTDVPKMSGDGKYVYAIIEHSNAGIFKEFKIEVSETTKDPTNLDDDGKFVEFSNILLAEQMMDESVDPPVPKMVQRRVGNLALVHQVVSGRICLWAYSSGGTSL